MGTREQREGIGQWEQSTLRYIRSPRNFGEGSRADGEWSRKPAWKMHYGAELRPVVRVEDSGPKASPRFGHLRCRF